MILAKMLIGSVLVLLIHVVSGSKNFFLSGLIPLFPTFTLIAYYTVGTSRPAADLKETILFGMLSLIPYLAYCLTFYFTIDRCEITRGLLYSACSWVVLASLLVFAWNFKQITGSFAGPKSNILENASTIDPSEKDTDFISVEDRSNRIYDGELIEV